MRLALAGGSVAWQPRKFWQLDLLVEAEFNQRPADTCIVLGDAILIR